MTTRSLWTQLLEDELATRRRRNPRYSLRAFARDLDVHASDLSRYMRGKKAMPARTARTALGHCAWDKRRIEQFAASLFKDLEHEFLVSVDSSLWPRLSTPKKA